MSNFHTFLSKAIFLSMLISNLAQGQDNKIFSAGKPETIPASHSEALSMAESLTGVASIIEMSNTFHVSGGSSNDNSLLLEGISLPQPRQIRNNYQECISHVNPWLLQNLQLMPGYLPARYGERLHSVILAEYRKSTDEPVRGLAEMSLIDAGMMLEGKMLGSGYWAMAGRWVDKELVLGNLQTKGDYNPKYYDVQFISRIPLLSRHKLNLLGIMSKNDYSFEPEDFQARYGVGYGSYDELYAKFDGLEQSLFQSNVFSAMLESKVSAAIKMRNYVIMSYTEEGDKQDLSCQTRQRFDILSATNEAEGGEIFGEQFEFKNNIFHEKSITYKNELTINLPKHVLQLGGYINRRKFNDNLEETFNINSQAIDDTIESKEESYSFIDSAELSNDLYVMYGEDTWQPSSRLSLNYGIRAHHFTYNDEWSIEPRFRFKYTISPKSWLAIAWGQYSQPPQYREFRDSNHNLLTNVKSQKANQAVISFSHRYKSQTEIRAEAYYIDLTRLIPYDYEEIFPRYWPEYHARGKTYGLSFYWNGKFNQRLNSSLSYNYMVSRQKIQELGGEEFPTPTDQRHTIAMVFQDDLPNLPNMRVYLRALFGSGYPFTAYRAAQNIENGLYYAVESKRLSSRTPYYRRIDVGVSYAVKVFKEDDLKLVCELYNVFDFRNLFSYKYFVPQDGYVQKVRTDLSRRLYNFRINFSF